MLVIGVRLFRALQSLVPGAAPAVAGPTAGDALLQGGGGGYPGDGGVPGGEGPNGEPLGGGPSSKEAPAGGDPLLAGRAAASGPDPAPDPTPAPGPDPRISVPTRRMTRGRAPRGPPTGLP